MYGCKRWATKKAEHWRIDAFELWCWWRLLRVTWTARRSNQSVLKEISPEHSLEGLMLKLKLQYFDHLVRRADSLEKSLMLEKVEGRRRRGRQRIRWLNSLTGLMDMDLSTFRETVKDREAWWTWEVHGPRRRRVRHDLVTERQQQPFFHNVSSLWAVFTVFLSSGCTWAVAVPPPAQREAPELGGGVGALSWMKQSVPGPGQPLPLRAGGPRSQEFSPPTPHLS